MASRTVSVLLQAEIASYVTGMTKAAIATKGVGEAADTTSTKASKGFDLAGRGAQMFGLAAAGALVGIIAKSMDFEKSMSGVQAATQASAATMGQLRDAALKAGADTQYSATQAADAITEMAKAGVSAKDIMGGGLKGALNLAAAGQLDVADAAGIASTAMTQFSLSGSQLPHVADLLAAGAGKAMGSVDDMGQALNQAGLLASSAGISIEETTGTLAAFASAGLIGSDAGTSLKTMLQQLQAPSKQSSELMSELGISAYDAQGNFVGLAGLAQQLKDHLGGLTQAQRDNALATIFGSDAARAATVLYREGAAGIDDWTGKVNDAGYAQRQAAQLTDNLAGDLERLGGSFDTLLISIGSGLQGPLRGLTQMFGGLVDGAGSLIGAFGNLPGPVQAAIVAFGGWAIAGGKIKDVFGTVLEKLAPIKDALASGWDSFTGAISTAAEEGDGFTDTVLNIGKAGAEAAGNGLKALGKAIGPELGMAAAAFVVGQLVEGFNSIANASDSAKKSAEGLAQALTLTDRAADRKAVRQAIEDTDGLTEALGRAGISSRDAIDGLLGNEAAVKRVDAALQNYMHTQRTPQQGGDAEAIRQAILSYDELAGSYDNAAGTARYFADSSTNAGTAATTAADQTSVASQDAQKAYEDWINSMVQIGTAFVEPIAIYQDLLQGAAQATADATKSSKDSWKDYADSAKVSLDQFAQELQNQIADQENWRTNLVTVAQRAGYDVAAQLEQMGVQGAGLVAQMANSTDAEMLRMAELLRKDAALGGSQATTALDNSMQVMAAIGAAGASATAAGISAALNIGINDVAAIAAQYGVTLATGFEPVLGALGKQVHLKIGGPSGRGQIGINADGNLYEAHQAEIAPAGAMRLWAEPETGGEAYIPLAPSKRARSVGIWQETGKRLGVFADGGFTDAGSVPRPYSTAPYGPLVAAPSDATMSTEYDAAVAWLNANMSSVDPGGAGVQRWSPLVLRALSMMGQPASLLNTVLRRMNQESGGNPRAINLTDINAKRGTPSKGLMQTIDPTFRAYHFPGTSNDVYDPLANILASMRYAMARYGSLSAAYNRKGGYAAGTDFVPETGDYQLHKSEAVLNPREAEAYRAGIRSRETSGDTAGGWGGGGVGPVTVNARVFIGNREITDIARVEAQAVVGDAMNTATSRTQYSAARR